MCFYLKMLIQFHVVLFYMGHYYIIRLHFTLTRTHGYTLYFNIIYMCLYVSLFKNFNINSIIIYMCLYVHIFLFKNFNTNLTLFHIVYILYMTI